MTRQLGVRHDFLLNETRKIFSNTRKTRRIFVEKVSCASSIRKALPMMDAIYQMDNSFHLKYIANTFHMDGLTVFFVKKK